MPLRRKRVEVPPWLSLAAIVAIVTIAAPLLGGIRQLFSDYEKVATKPYVDDRIVESKKYTDDTAAQVLKEAFSHSDANRQSMLLRLEEMNTEIRTNQSAVSTKVDMVLRAVQDMRTESWNASHGFKSTGK